MAAQPVTRNMVLSRTRAPDLAFVKKLNLFGAGVTDAGVLGDGSMGPLEVLSASSNAIHDSAFEQICAGCPNLGELYLRGNRIQRPNSLGALAGLTQLRILWIADNPVCSSLSPHDLRMVLCHLVGPGLEILDNEPVTEAERTMDLSRADKPDAVRAVIAEASARHPGLGIPALAGGDAGRPRPTPAADPRPSPAGAPGRSDLRAVPAAGAWAGPGPGAAELGGVAAPGPVGRYREEAHAGSARVAGRTKEGAAGHAMLTAVMALVEHLDDGSLSAVRRRCDALLAGMRG